MVGRSFFVAALIAVSTSSVEAFWRLPCGNSVVIERGDPIISPGQVSGHVHNILGGSNFALETSFAQLRESECTSCLVKQDMSNYWTPQLYFQWANGSFSSVSTTGGGLIYYLLRYNPSDTTNITAFPDGLRMLTGNPFKRFYNSSSLMDQAIGWNCLGADVETTRNPYLPPYNCPDGLRGEIRFPSCWDGVNVDSSDHFSHMAYPIGGETGPCPSSHPVRVVTLFYEIMWSVDPWNDVRSEGLNTTQPFVLAMGDSTGYGYHGDFFNGWDGNVLQEAINTCTSDSGVIEYCTVFDLYDPSHECHKTPDVDEVVLGTFTSLPGCNPVTGFTGGYVSSCTDPNTPEIFTNPVAYNGSAPPPGSNVTADQPSVLLDYQTWTYQDCYSDLINGARSLPNGLTTVNKTVEACLDACMAKGYVYCGVEYHGECWGGNTLSVNSTALGYGSCGLTCTDNSLQYCGGTGGAGSASMELYTRPAPASTTTTSTTTTSAAVSATTSKTVSTTSISMTTTSAAASASSSLTGKLTTSSKWTYKGCYSDLVNSARSLPNTLTSNSTIEGCLAAATAGNYSVFAVSYGGECYAANALSPYSTALAASKCAMTCNSNKNETCGGSASLDVYYSTSLPILTGPTNAQLATFGNWTYDACYSDLVNNQRSLPLSLTKKNQTIEGCLSLAASVGANIAGLSYYSECYFSTTGNISANASVLPDTSCRFPCKGNPNEMCGGNAALSVWRIPSAVSSRARRAVELEK